MIQKKCQCGATPRFHVVKNDRRGRRIRAMRERLQCHFCGNATKPSANRQDLTDEWNSAGWCGQAEVMALGTEVGGRRAEVGVRDHAFAIGFDGLAELHPREAYAIDPERMMAYCRGRNPALSDEAIKRCLTDMEGGGI